VVVTRPSTQAGRPVRRRPRELPSNPTDFFAIGCGCLGAVGGVLFSIGVTLAHPTALAPPWLQSLGLSAIQFELVLAIVFTAAAVLAFAEDEWSRYERH